MKYKLILILYLNILCLCQLPKDDSSYINNKDFSIKEAIYIIRNRKGNVNLEYEDLRFTNTKNRLKQNFEIIKDKKGNNNSEIFYFIKEKDFNVLLSADKEGDELIIYYDEIDLDYALWNITPKINEENKLIYYVQNKKTKCYWELSGYNNIYELQLSRISNESDLNSDHEFLFRELYTNVDNNKKSKILEKEPIDVLIKYIDLTDTTIDRTGIGTLQKDYEHGEIKYSVRSILKNIPWINKIFILMPNERVKYFKPKEEISDKIIYVKDKDLLGFDSGNSCTFQYNLFKMRKFGLSENFILMDDDYFIANPINKNEMFYEENGEVYPAIITSDYYEIEKGLINQNIEQWRNRRGSNDPHTTRGFHIRQNQALLFLFEIFGSDNLRYGKKLIEPSFSHNAIPLRMSDLEEIYNYIDKYYEYGKDILFAKERTMKDLQFQSLYWGYVKNKYNRKVCRIPSQFFALSIVSKIKVDKYKLFVINNSQKKYNPILLDKEKEILEKLFPQKTKYEWDGEEFQNTDIISQKRVEEHYILFKLINRLETEIRYKSKKFEFSLDKMAVSKKLNKYINDTKYLNKILKEELNYMQQQCLWQEKIIIILLIFFLLLLIYICAYNKNNYAEFNI